MVLNGHTHWVRSVAFSPNGKHIVSGSDDNSVRVWDSASWYIRERVVDSSYDQYTGWLLSPHSSIRFMFVPPEALLPDASNILAIPRSARSYVDLTHATLGLQWAECYHP
jgi:WD40 repeat protein